jgi:hypothetical protein
MVIRTPGPRAAALAAAVAGLSVSVFAADAFAQGRGKGPGKIGGSTAGGSVAVAAASAPSTMQFGSWLDDASAQQPGEAWTALSLGYFRAAGNEQTGFPMFDASLGVRRRVALGVTVPYYRISLPDGTGASGLGDVYLSGKFVLVDPGASRYGFGIAVSPVLEVLADPEPDGNRYSLGVPFSFELRADGYRVFGSTGFFSRGVFFGSGALEIPLTDRTVLTGALTTSRSLDISLEEELLAVSRNRTDVTGVVAYFLTPSVAPFGGIGRTLGSTPFGTSIMLVGGISLTLAPHTLP